ncbi:MAG: RraA family protein [Spirochaetia bacterium]|nr:RraA family protein [Spirochaetia bacterium]MCF7945307.1 RraA family protein [Spirochaetia bacterium]MCF7946590.1 RraA family protein [Spirochaetia bacterium]
MDILTKAQIEELKEFDTPTVCNAIERFNLRSRTEGFMSPKIKSLFPDNKPVVGYAGTAKISAEYPPNSQQKKQLFDYYQHIIDSPNPTISVIQDLDETPVGSFWGEVQANTHKSLGCSSVITNGGVRDLDEVHSIGFSYFASCVLVSHGYIHVEQVGVPVHFGGLTVHPGDLIHADKHGVVLIPHEISHELADACILTQQAERPILDGCKRIADGKVTVEQLRRWRAEMIKLRSSPGKK